VSASDLVCVSVCVYVHLNTGLITDLSVCSDLCPWAVKHRVTVCSSAHTSVCVCACVCVRSVRVNKEQWCVFQDEESGGHQGGSADLE